MRVRLPGVRQEVQRLLNRIRPAILLAVLAGGSARGAPAGNEPHLGYLWPTGGKQGTTLKIWVGGQRLRGMNRIYVSGTGVTGKVIWYAPTLNNNDFDELRRRQEERAKKAKGTQAGADTEKSEPLSDNPLLDVLEALDPKELQVVLSDFFNPYSKRQPNPQLSETAYVEINIAPDAPPGDRDVRIGTPAGLTNAMVFQVSTLPEVYEIQQFGVIKRPTPLLKPPVIANGQITPGDVDRYPLRVRRGQHLVIRAYARRLNPFLADAVPGWLQAVLTLYDAKGNQVAYSDDYRFDPDPVILYEPTEDADYTLEIRDAIYRGREDFVYRIAVSERPFITRIFPLGARTGTEAVASVAGWNLPEKQIRLDTRPGGPDIRWATFHDDPDLSNRVPYAVDDLPDRVEKERNNSLKEAEAVSLPLVVNGIVEGPGDVDVFRFEGRAGQEVVADVQARCLGSPLDSIVRLLDASGKTLAWNDDYRGPWVGLLTHQADSHLSLKLPADGAYFVALTDAQSHGDEAHAYRLRISAPQHDFALCVTPATVNMPASGIYPLTVFARRKDGFDGDIALSLRDAPEGYRLDGARVPRGQERVQVALSAPPGRQAEPFTLKIEGRARIGDAEVTHLATPAEEVMQAFAYWHQVPVRDMLVDASRERKGTTVGLPTSEPARIPAGAAARLEVRVPWRWALSKAEVELVNPPKGISFVKVAPSTESLIFIVKADPAVLKPGDGGNILAEAFAKGDKGGRYSLGLLPAIPFEITGW